MPCEKETKLVLSLLRHYRWLSRLCRWKSSIAELWWSLQWTRSSFLHISWPLLLRSKERWVPWSLSISTLLRAWECEPSVDLVHKRVGSDTIDLPSSYGQKSPLGIGTQPQSLPINLIIIKGVERSVRSKWVKGARWLSIIMKAARQLTTSKNTRCLWWHSLPPTSWSTPPRNHSFRNFPSNVQIIIRHSAW